MNFTTTEVIYFTTIYYTLTTHKTLTTQQLINGSNYITNFLLKFRNLSLIDFLTFTNQNYIGKLCFTHNHILIHALQHSNYNIINLSLQNISSAFYELSNPTYFTSSELNIINKNIIITKSLMDELITKITKKITNHQFNITSLPNLTTTCYNKICLLSNNINDHIQSILYQSNIPNDYIYTIDNNIIYKFSLHEILNLFYNHNSTNFKPINPFTNSPFSSLTQYLIIKRLTLELKIYSLYKSSSQSLANS